MIQNKIIINPQGIKYQVIREIGKGSFGVVYKAIDVQTRKIYAIKTCKQKKYEKSILNQIKLLQSVDHPNIIKCFDYFCEKDIMYMVLQYCGKGDFKNFKEKININEDLAHFYIVKILSGLQHLHSKSIVHRDLKLDNILVNDSNQLKLADFGLSKDFGMINILQTYCGTPITMAPEILDLGDELKKYNIDSQKTYNSTCDTWSLGVISYLLVEGQYPFDPKRVIKNGGKIGLRADILALKKFKFNERTSEQFKQFIQKCLMKNYKKRPTTKQLLANDVWINKKTMQSMIKVTKILTSNQQNEPKIISVLKHVINTEIKRHTEQMIEKSFLNLDEFDLRIKQFMKFYPQNYQNQLDFLLLFSRRIKDLQKIIVKITVGSNQMKIKSSDIKILTNHTKNLNKILQDKIKILKSKHQLIEQNCLNNLLKFLIDEGANQAFPVLQLQKFWKFLSEFMTVVYLQTALSINFISQYFNEKQQILLKSFIQQSLDQQQLWKIIDEEIFEEPSAKNPNEDWKVNHEYIQKRFQDFCKTFELSYERFELVNILKRHYDFNFIQKIREYEMN